MDPVNPVIVLPGAGGRAPDAATFRAGLDDVTRFETISYPGWRHYAASGFSGEALIADLATQIAARVPHGPIRIVGISIGGHFGYAAALHLQAIGREIAGFCAIDTFMISSSEPSAGWMGRSLERSLDLLRQRRIGEFTRFVRSLAWRAPLRLARGRLPSLLRGVASFGRLPSALAFDPILEEEVSMRLLIRGTAPWLASLDREPVAMKSPTILLRTRFAAHDDAAWHRRCPNMEIYEIPGQHETLFDPENIGSLREAFVNATRDWRTDIA